MFRGPAAGSGNSSFARSNDLFDRQYVVHSTDHEFESYSLRRALRRADRIRTAAREFHTDASDRDRALRRGRLTIRRESRLGRSADARAGFRGRHDLRADRGVVRTRIEVAPATGNRRNQDLRLQTGWNCCPRIPAHDPRLQTRTSAGISATITAIVKPESAVANDLTRPGELNLAQTHVTLRGWMTGILQQLIG